MKKISFHMGNRFKPLIPVMGLLLGGALVTVFFPLWREQRQIEQQLELLQQSRDSLQDITPLLPQKESGPGKYSGYYLPSFPSVKIERVGQLNKEQEAEHAAAD